MAIDLAARRLLEATQRTQSLDTALDRWVNDANGLLQSNQSQLLSAERMLRVVLARLQDTAAPLSPRDHLRLTVHAHSVWEALNARFAQRTDALFRNFLALADQLAYDCYFPALQLAPKAPPLVVLAGALDPQMFLRNQGLFLDPSSPLRDALPEVTAASHFPFPLITLPWHQPRHQEGLVFIAHEVGHAVEDDLRLTPGLQLAIASAAIPGGRLVHWLRWQRELFADHWACQACGEAYVCALADYLSISGADTPAVAEGSKYPPAWLRIQANLYFLHQLGLPATNAAVWQALYPTVPADKDFVGDLSAYAPCLTTGAPPFPLDGVSQADRLAASWGSEFAQAPQNRSMRVSAAAYRLAYETEPDGAWTTGANQTLQNAVITGVRSGNNTSASDEASGAGLLAMLLDAPLPTR